ncbi:hypothetical protein AURDEDRAFT_130122 [Auricularia subglabra TFB-10046 SS5]|uniref:Uncharacterized protein n=1 Tax=Auricularia subglabra (strain TFB-10046 / SS5) TaxID=717982 RepID=J0WU93_AURST|nr:hypothetical protein AURDEDRAFT_130122 [Auricularia subglabra TFB-10046 SS5]
MRSDAHARTIEHAVERKARFDKEIVDTRFSVGDIVQVYQDRLDSTFETSAKLAAKWSGPMRIVAHYVGSWKVRDLEASEGGLFVSGRRLRRWVPTRGTKLEREIEERAKAKAKPKSGGQESRGQSLRGQESTGAPWASSARFVLTVFHSVILADRRFVTPAAQTGAQHLAFFNNAGLTRSWDVPPHLAPNAMQTLDLRDLIGDDAEEAQAWMRDFKKHMLVHTLTLTAARLPEAHARAFPLHIAPGSEAETWWNGLTNAERGAWVNIQLQFDARWPPVQARAIPVTEHIDAFYAHVFDASEIETRIPTGVGNGTRHAHTVFAKKLKMLGAKLTLPDAALIRAAVKQIPPAMAELMQPHSRLPWDAWCVRLSELDVEEIKAKQVFFDRLDALETHVATPRQAALPAYIQQRYAAPQSQPAPPAWPQPAQAAPLVQPTPPPKNAATMARVEQERKEWAMPLPELEQKYRANVKANLARAQQQGHPAPMTPGALGTPRGHSTTQRGRGQWSTPRGYGNRGGWFGRGSWSPGPSTPGRPSPLHHVAVEEEVEEEVEAEFDAYEPGNEEEVA